MRRWRSSWQRARDAIAVAFDPCNGRRADSGYVTVATGRDYRDVGPTSGTYVGTSHGRLTTSRRVGILAAALSRRASPDARHRSTRVPRHRRRSGPE